MNPLLRWTTLSVLVLSTVVGLIYWAVIAHAQNTVGPMMGRGPSVSEEVERVTGALSLWGALLVGLVALAATSTYWRVRRAAGNVDGNGPSGAMKASLVLMPLALSVTCMLISYVSYMLFIGPQ